MLQRWVLIGPSAVSRAGPLHEDAWTHQHHAVANEWLRQGVVKEIGGMGEMEKGCGGLGWSSLCCTLSKDELGDSRTLAEPREWLGELIFVSRSGQGPCRRDQQRRLSLIHI